MSTDDVIKILDHVGFIVVLVFVLAWSFGLFDK